MTRFHPLVSRRVAISAFAVLTALAVYPSAADARRQKLDLRRVSIDLPGAPAIVLAADLDRDGDQDLTIAVAYTEWDQLSIEESTEMVGIEGLVEVMTIVPALADRRELRVYLADAEVPGGFRAVPHVIPLSTSILSLELGPPEWPVVALTDDGLSVLRLDAEEKPHFEPVLEDRPVLAGTGALIPRLGMVHDLDADGGRDLLLAAREGLAVYPVGANTSRGTWQAPASSRLVLPTDEHSSGKRGALRRYPLPRVADVNGDTLADLLFPSPDDGWASVQVLRGLGEGRFSAPLGPFEMPEPCDSEAAEQLPGCLDTRERMVYFGDVDNDGVAEYVSQESLETEDAGMRQEMKEAKRPPYRYRLYRSGAGLAPAAEPYVTFDALGYTFNGGTTEDDEEFSIPGGFQDLDGDGRRDLIALTLDFSMFQAVRIMTTRTISIGLDFHLYCQDDRGGFTQVPNLDLSGRFKINIDDVRLSQLSLFDGDFDGDGRADFVQLGRGKKVSIHRGQENCAYPSKPDLTLKLAAEPRDLALVEIEDLDGDGLSDLRIVQPNKIEEAGVTPPVRLDLYLSGQPAHKVSTARAENLEEASR